MHPVMLTNVLQIGHVMDFEYFLMSEYKVHMSLLAENKANVSPGKLKPHG